jgi:hypothetical protein
MRGIPGGYRINGVNQIGRYLIELKTLPQCRLVQYVERLGVEPGEVRIKQRIRLDPGGRFAASS